MNIDTKTPLTDHCDENGTVTIEHEDKRIRCRLERVIRYKDKRAPASASHTYAVLQPLDAEGNDDIIVRSYELGRGHVGVVSVIPDVSLARDVLEYALTKKANP